MPNFETAIFDLDGTLADTLPLIYRAFNSALEPAMGRRFGDDEIRALFGPPDNWILRNLLPGEPGDAAFARYLALYEAEHDQFVTAFQGVDDVVRRAFDAGVRLGVVTGKSRVTALLTLERLGFLPRFRAVYAGDDVQRQKPDPEAVTRILAELGHSAGAAGAFIGDSAADVEAGRAAGLTTIAVTWGSPDHTALFASEPDWVVHTAEQLGVVLGV